MIGAVVGTLAALMSGSRAPEPTTESREHTGARALPAPVPTPTPTRTAASPPPPAPAAPAAAPAPAPIASVARPATELDALPRKELEKRCALRQPQACLACAREVAARDPEKARVYRSLAVSLLDERCFERDAESCEGLAELYRTGTGVEKNEATAATLATRARELCKGKTSSFCEKLGGR